MKDDEITVARYMTDK